MENTNDRKLTTTLTSGIISLVDATLCILIAVALIIVLKSGVVGGGTGLGFAVVLILFFPFAIVCFVPIALHAMYKIIFGILLIKAYLKLKKGEDASKGRWTYSVSFVWRIVTTIFMVLEAFLVYSIFEAGKSLLLGVIFIVVIILMIALQVFAIVIETKSKSKRY